MGEEVFYVASCISYSSVAVNHLTPPMTKRTGLFGLMVLAHTGQDVAEHPSSHADGPRTTERESGRQIAQRI